MHADADAGAPTALITGVAGQDGIHLARHLLADGWRVVGTVRAGSASLARTAPYLDGVQLVTHDLLDTERFSTLLTEHAPQAVYNLAGFSSVGRSWDAPALVVRVNAMAVIEMLDAMVAHREATGTDLRFFQASTAEIFGTDVYGALDEDTAHRPRTPYAVAKSAAHDAVISYREKHGLFACNGILFNHESAFRGQQFVAGKICRAAAEIAAGRPARIVLGDIDIERDWGAAVDYVGAMALSLAHDTPDDYVIATGRTHTLRDMLVAAFAAVGIDDPLPHVTLDPRMWSTTQASALMGDASRAQHRLGWTATTGFEALIGGMVATDVRRIATGVEESMSYMA